MIFPFLFLYEIDFNPLPPHGGRLSVNYCQKRWLGNFNPLPPHGGRRLEIFHRMDTTAISIHSLRMEGDPAAVCVHNRRTQFQSTPSAWRETDAACVVGLNKYISIHSLRMEGDPHVRLLQGLHQPFQSTPSAWRETQARPARSCQALHFNPLPPHGGRRPQIPQARQQLYFNPLPPHGGRPSTTTVKIKKAIFQSTPSAWRETRHFVNPHIFA